MSGATAPALCAVTGLAREARVLEGLVAQVVVGGSDSARLSELIERAVQDGARALISVGIAGGLRPGLPPGTPVVASSVIASGESFPTTSAWSDMLIRRISGSVVGAVVGQDGIADAQQKEALYRTTSALAVDMESHVVARIARSHGLPFAVLRIVSDPAERSLPNAALVAMRPDGGINLVRVTKSVVARPSQIPALVRTAMDARIAFRALVRCCHGVAPGFGVSEIVHLVRDVP